MGPIEHKLLRLDLQLNCAALDMKSTREFNVIRTLNNI